LGAEPFTLEHFRAWVGKLTLDSGQPFKLEPFQLEFVSDLFEGRPENWLILPEGNGKSTLLAAIGLYHCRHVEDAFVPIAAASKEQARIIYKQAKGFVRRDTRALGFRAYDGYKRIDCKPVGSELEVFSADDRTGDGIIPTLCFLDELHRQKNLNLYQTWRGKLRKRGAQLVTISTAGVPGTEFEEARSRIRTSAEAEQREFFTRVRSDEVLYHEWAVPTDQDVEDMEVVKRANPLSTITARTLEKKFSTPTMTVGHWRRFTCNQPTRDEFAAVSEREWNDCFWKDDIPKDVPVGVGIDLGWVHDTTALVPLWIRDPEWRQFAIPRILKPPGGGEMLSGRLIEQALIDINKRNPITLVVMDMSVGGRQLADWIEDNIHPREIVDRNSHNQSAAEDYSAFMEALREGWLKQPGDPEFTRHVLNAIAKVLPQGDTRFVRPTQSRHSESEQDLRVIDALWAAAAVHSVMAADLDAGDPVFDWGPIVERNAA